MASALSSVRWIISATMPCRFQALRHIHIRKSLPLVFGLSERSKRNLLTTPSSKIGNLQLQRSLKVKSAIKRRCKHCRIEMKLGLWHVICEESPRHNQRQRGKLPPPELQFFPYFFRSKIAK